MRVFVTGAGGFIGRHLLARLQRDGHAVTALLLPAEGAAGLAAARVVRGDIADPASLAGLLDGHGAVVHLAARVGYGQPLEACRKVNVEGTRNLAAAAVAAGVRRFVQLSSVSVYGRVPDRPLAEDAAMRRSGDPYGDTKIEAEELLRAHAARGELDLTVLRPTVVYGPGDRLFLPRLVENLRAGRARIVGSGTNPVDALHVEDLVEVVARVLADPATAGRTYNLNHPGNPTWRELVTAVAAWLGVPAPRGHVPFFVALMLAGAAELAARVRGVEPRLTRYAVRVVGRRYEYRVDRARAELGFEPRIALLEGVRRELAPPGARDPARP